MRVTNELKKLKRVGILEIVISLCEFCLCSAVGLTDRGQTCYLLDMFVIVLLLTG